MSTYIIGDIHGCYVELKNILYQVQFNPVTDTLWLTGDLTIRGPRSLDVLRFIKSLGNCVRIVLGNHDLHLIAIYTGIDNDESNYQIKSILEAPDIDELIYWLRHQPILQIDREKKIIMVHAGIAPQWDISMACQYANEIENILKSNNYSLFIKYIYKNMQNDCIQGPDEWIRLHYNISVFTRMRYCFSNGQLEMSYKDSPKKAPVSLKPWFNLPMKIPNSYSIVFGHWSTLSGQKMPINIYGLDTGCCWGGKLTMLNWENKTFIRIPCYD